MADETHDTLPQAGLSSGAVARRRRNVPLGGHCVLSPQEWSAIAATLNLSPRELQIIQRVFDDKIESRIASELGIATSTVHTHLERLYRKLKVHTRCALVVRVVVQQRLLESNGHR